MTANDLQPRGMYHIIGRRLGCKSARRYAFCELVAIDTTGGYRVATFFQAWRNLTVRMLVADIAKVAEA